MDHQEFHHSTTADPPPQTIWETLTAAQQEAVLQAIVWICCQIAENWTREVVHEPTA
jgi:hypothetical protein